VGENLLTECVENVLSMEMRRTFMLVLEARDLPVELDLPVEAVAAASWWERDANTS
jgi:hypothetical protein